MTLSRKELIELMATLLANVSTLKMDTLANRRVAINEFLSVLDQAGMVIVPKEPTVEMQDAAADADGVLEVDVEGTTFRPARAWRAMIEAALTDQQI